MTMPVVATESTTVAFPTCRGCEDKIRVIDAIRAQERQAREDLRNTQEELLVTQAKLEEARRALDCYLGMRS